MMFSFAGTIGHFINDDWKLVERVIDFYHLQEKEHGGEYAAKAFMRSASKRGSLNKICIFSTCFVCRFLQLTILISTS